jgi:hypothetical protein
MLERTHIFVDTSYLLASFYNSWEIGARAQLEIDLPEVVHVLERMVESQFSQPVHRQFWYDGIPETGPHRYQRALRTCNGVQLRAGQLIEWGERRTQKAVDTRLVADMVLTGVRRDCTDIVLVSGDADMIPGVQEAVNAGIRVHLYGFGWDSMSSALRHACDSTIILDPREDFVDCMQLQVLEGPIPTTATGGDEEETETSELSYRPGEPSLSQDEQDAEAAAICDEQFDNEPSPTISATTISAVEADQLSQPEKPQPKPSPSPADAPLKRPAPNPSMMAPRRKLRSRYVPLPNEVWTSAGFLTPFDVGQQYAIWWYENAATTEQRDSAHLLSGGGLPPEIDRPLLQFACETLHEYTLTEIQRVNLRDGFHSGIRGILLNNFD